VAFESAEWTFLVLILTFLIGPYLAERAGLPGIVGLLIGGMLVGPNVLGLIERGETVIGIGELGILYLMFIAGLELDLDEFERHRGEAIRFGLITFVFPFVLGAATGVLFGFEAAAAVLLGSVWASHTLVSYPIVQIFGLSQDRAVTTAVSGTVLTDTGALLILGFVSGAASGQSGIALVVSVGIGLGALFAFSFLVLPWLTRRLFAGLAQDRTTRFIWALAAFSSAGFVAILFGLEGIVGAFFAGLAVNRFIPKGSGLMERIELVGSTIFIPVFLISTGMLLDPASFLDAQVLAFGLACLGTVLAGKGLAAVLFGRLFGHTPGQVGLVFGLSVAQAAATLAATTVGVELGILPDWVLSSVLIVILATVIVSTVVTRRAAGRVGPAEVRPPRLGRSIVLPVLDADLPAVLPLAALLARADGGQVLPLAIEATGRPDGLDPLRERVEAVARAIRSHGVEAEPIVRLDSSATAGIVRTVAERAATSVVLGPTAAIEERVLDAIFGSTQEDIVLRSSVPVLLGIHGGRAPARILVPIRSGDLAPGRLPDVRLALDLAARVARDQEIDVLVLASRPEAVRPYLPDGGRFRVEEDRRGPSTMVRDRVEDADLVVLPGAGLIGMVGSSQSRRLQAERGVSFIAVAGPHRAASVPVGVQMGLSGVPRSGMA
jgi:Kef-type K+ transport system membrane component KefB